MTPVIVISSLTPEQKNAITAIVNAFGDMNLQFVDLNAFNANVGLPTAPIEPVAQNTDAVPSAEPVENEEEDKVSEDAEVNKDDAAKSAPLAANTDLAPVPGKMTIVSPGDDANFKFNVIQYDKWDAAPTLFADFEGEGGKNTITQGDWKISFPNGFKSGIIAGDEDLGDITGIECAGFDKLPTDLSHAAEDKTPLLVIALAQSDE